MLRFFGLRGCMNYDLGFLCLTRPAFTRLPWRITPCPCVHAWASLAMFIILTASKPCEICIVKSRPAGFRKFLTLWCYLKKSEYAGTWPAHSGMFYMLLFVTIHNKPRTFAKPHDTRALLLYYILSWHVREITSSCCSLVRSINLTAYPDTRIVKFAYSSFSGCSIASMSFSLPNTFTLR